MGGWSWNGGGGGGGRGGEGGGGGGGVDTPLRTMLFVLSKTVENQNFS